MSLEFVSKVLMMLRLLAFMLMLYLAFGLLVERYSRVPESQIKAFARTVCSPITRPVSRFLAPGTSYVRLLLVSMGVVGVLWAVVAVLGALVRP